MDHLHMVKDGVGNNKQANGKYVLLRKIEVVAQANF